MPRARRSRAPDPPRNFTAYMENDPWVTSGRIGTEEDAREWAEENAMEGDGAAIVARVVPVARCIQPMAATWTQLEPVAPPMPVAPTAQEAAAAPRTPRRVRIRNKDES